MCPRTAVIRKRTTVVSVNYTIAVELVESFKIWQVLAFCDLLMGSLFNSLNVFFAKFVIQVWSFHRIAYKKFENKSRPQVVSEQYFRDSREYSSP